MFDRLKEAGVQMIDIIGGEPTMHPDICQIIGEAARRGFFVNVSSNGSNVETLEEIAIVEDKITIGISINDRETLDHLREYIKKRRPVVKSVFSSGMDQGLIQDILSLDPQFFYLIYRDALDHKELQDTIPFYQFAEEVQHRFSASNVGTVFCSGFIPDRSNYPELDHVRCSAGTIKLGIMPDGSVYPCNLFFGKKELMLGNILIDKFESIWQHPALVFFRMYSENRCPQKDCKLHPQCHGGCPAQSLLLSGNLASPDPRCSPGSRHVFTQEEHSRYHTSRSP
jgi:radical SAM protein with 4Fe4S-binding SPASM domain